MGVPARAGEAAHPITGRSARRGVAASFSPGAKLIDLCDRLHLSQLQLRLQLDGDDTAAGLNATLKDAAVCCLLATGRAGRQ